MGGWEFVIQIRLILAQRVRMAVNIALSSHVLVYVKKKGGPYSFPEM